MSQVIRHFRVDTVPRNETHQWPTASILLDTDAQVFRVITRRPPMQFDKKLAKDLLLNDSNVRTYAFGASLVSLMNSCNPQSCPIELTVDRVIDTLNDIALDHARQGLHVESIDQNRLINALYDIHDTRELHKKYERVEQYHGAQIDRRTGVITFNQR